MTSTTTAATTDSDPSATPAMTASLPDLPSGDPSSHIRVLLARIAVIDARATVAGRRRSAAGAHDDQAQAHAALDRAVEVHTRAERRLREARDELGSTVVYAYMNGPGEDLSSALRGDATVGGKEHELFAASLDHHRQQVVGAREAVEGAGADVDAARLALDQAERAAADHDRRIVVSESALAYARYDLSTANAEEGHPTTSTSWQLSLEGPSAFTAEELAQWYDQQGHGSRASVPLAELARSYIDLGDAEGIRGDMAFAQSIHETGWFANNDTVVANNFSGIGHCSACARGFPYATAEIGVLAQIQLLKSYAEAEPIYNRPRADPDLNGPRGCCQTWTELAGVWASDPGYGYRILAYYHDMLAWLVAERTAES